MTVITPPHYLTVDGAYNGDDLGLPFRDIISGGAVDGGLAVTQKGSGADMSVDVAAGVAWVPGTTAPDSQPIYRCRNDGTVNLSVSAADPTDDRLDLVIAEVRDSSFSGANDDWRLVVLTGTPGSSPVAPTLPDNAIALATLSVTANASSVTDGDITDNRDEAKLGSTATLDLPVLSPATLVSEDYLVISHGAFNIANSQGWIGIAGYDEIDDPTELLDNGTGVITIAKAGLYLIDFLGLMSARLAQFRVVIVSAVIGYTANVASADGPSNNRTLLRKLSVGDEISFNVSTSDSDSNGTKTVDSFDVSLSLLTTT